MNRKLILRSIAALAGVVPTIALVAPGGNAAAVASTLVPPAAVYGLGGPDTPLPMTYSTSASPVELVVTADGFVSSIACPPAFTATVSEGAGVITSAVGSPIAAATSVPCTISLALGEGAPASIQVTVSERDAFNIELGSKSQIVTLEQVDVTVSVGAVALTGGTYREAEPRTIGDQLSRSVTFTLGASRALSFAAPSGATMTGCVSGLAAAATCALSRTLSLSDLADGTALVAPTLLVDGFPVSRPAADIPVPSERRIGVTASASATAVRVGESVTIQAVVSNLGSIDLTGLVVSGAGISGATCDGSAPAALTLVRGQSVTCTATHLATAADVGAVTPVVVRATAAFGIDSDLINDDATSSTDIDATSGVAPYSVIDAEIAAVLSLGTAVAFVDDAGTDTLTLSLTVSSVGALAGVSVTLPTAPFDGVTITGCDSVVKGGCIVALGSVAGGVPVIRVLDVVVDSTSLPAGGVDGGLITGTLRADGGIEVAATSAVLRTAGVTAALVDSVVDASGSQATSSIEITVADGHPVAITLAPATARPVTVTGCITSAGTAITVVPSAEGAMLGTLPGGSDLSCTLRQDVVATDRTAATMPVDVSVVVSAGSIELTRPLHADLTTIALVVTPGPAPAAPARGYSVSGAEPRPNSLVYSFELTAYGDPTLGDTVPPGPTFGSSPDQFACSAPVAGRWSCVGTHMITAADLAGGDYTATIEVSVGATAEVMAELVIPTPHEAIDVLVTELSSPAGPNGYRTGDPIRLLVQVRNTGSMPIVFEGITSSLPIQSAQVSSALTEAVDGCAGGQSITPGSTADCDVTVSVPVGFTATTVTVGVQTAQLGLSTFNFLLALDPTPPAAPVPTLPATGSPSAALAALAVTLLLLGILLRRMAGSAESPTS